jgi:type I restriction-modification system DNA methylase subunit
VDYRDLEVRHLGSVYEKLLEYELDIATEPLALKGKGQAYVPAKDEASAIKKAGEVYLRTGNNERKVTGSYYTPDYIVRFIVEKTLAPVLEAIAERHATRDDDGQWHVRDSDALVRDVLALNVLDPATGSGHFVVDATSYIAEWLADLAIRPDDLGDEDELTYWKRQVASACIYAVDINPLAVELAKLSMWLTTLAQGKPLSFLDHHIRVGNSLVGTSIFDISDDLDDEKRRKKRQREQAKAEAVGQMMMFSDDDFADGVAYAVAEMHKIEQTRADDVSVVKQQEAQFEQLKARLKTWQRASDVWTARAFGLSLTAEQWQTIRALRQQDALPNGIAKVVSEAERIAHDNRFFHWELAFPEIFFNEDGTPKDDGGFDAVIGNPPYVRQERITPIKPFLESQYDVYSGTADLFLYFYERGLEFVRDGHRLGYITSGTYMNSNSAKPFRAYLHREAGMEWVANFGENQPFKGAEMVYPTIAVLRRHTPAKTFKHLFMEGNVPFADLQATLEDATWDDSLSEVMGMDEWRFQSAELTRLFQKITQGKKTLLEHVGDVFHYGIKTGFNEAFIIEEDKYQELIKADSKNEEIIKPMLRGQDLRPWYNNESGQYLIFAYQGIDIDAYPTIKAHLAQYRKDLEPKPEDWDNKRDGNWQGRASGSYKWYELQTPFSNPQVFAEPKIMWAEIAKLPRMSLAQDEFYMNNKCYFISSGSYSLLGVLQSRVAWFVAGQIATPLRLRSGLWQYQLFKQFIERLPIPELTDAQEKRLAEIAEKITGLAQARYKAHEGVRETIANEFGAGESISTRVDLYRWWELDDEKALSDELKKRWGREIAIGKRSEWRDYLAKEKAKHEDYTAKIVALEEEMNAIVYEAFDLTPEEIALIEASTKYKYGGV